MQRFQFLNYQLMGVLADVCLSLKIPDIVLWIKNNQTSLKRVDRFTLLVYTSNFKPIIFEFVYWIRMGIYFDGIGKMILIHCLRFPKLIQTIYILRQNLSLHTILLLKQDSINKLAKNVVYPLKRQNPIPDIELKEVFISLTFRLS